MVRRIWMLALAGCGFQGPGASVGPSDGAAPPDIAKPLADAAGDAARLATDAPKPPVDAAVPIDAPANSSFLIEAEQYNKINAQPANSFALATDIAGYRGTGFMHCGPQTGGDCVLPVSNCSSLTYDLPNAAAGNYYVHLRMYAVDTSDDSIYITVDGSAFDEVDPPHGAWSWLTSGQPYALTAGDHTLTLYRRECGARVDQVSVSMSMAPPP